MRGVDIRKPVPNVKAVHLLVMMDGAIISKDDTFIQEGYYFPLRRCKSQEKTGLRKMLLISINQPTKAGRQKGHCSRYSSLYKKQGVCVCACV